MRDSEFDMAKECEKIDYMDEGELKAYLADLDVSANTNMLDEDIVLSIARTVCFNRAKNKLEGIKSSTIRRMLRV